MIQHLKALGAVIAVGAFCFWGFRELFEARSADVPSDYATLEVMEKEGVPNFSFKNLDDVSLDLNSLKGKVIILNFWASWCGPCIEEVPSLVKLVKEFKGEVQLIAISGDSNREDIDIFMKSFPELRGKNIHVVWDEDRSLMKRFQVIRLPESMVLGQDQKLVKKIVGTIDWYNEDSIGYMKSLGAKN